MPIDVHAMGENEFWVITGLPNSGKSHLARRLTSKQARVLVFDPTKTIQGKQLKSGARRGAFPGMVTDSFNEFDTFVRGQTETKSGFRAGLIDTDVVHLEKWMELVLELQDVPLMDTPEFPLVIWIEEAALAMPQVGKERKEASKLLAKILRIRQHIRTTIIITTQYAEDTPRSVRKQSEIFITFQQLTGDNLQAIKEKGIPQIWIDQIPNLKRGEHLVQRGTRITKVSRDGRQMLLVP